KVATTTDVVNAVNNAGFTATVGRDDSDFEDQGSAENKPEELINAGDKVVMQAGRNLKIKQETDQATGETKFTYALADELNIDSAQVGGPGKDGRDGKDGFIGVNGADGKAGVAINGKDGSIGLTGPRGADGKDGASATLKVEQGAKGLDGNNGKDGETKTRIVYVKPNGEKETVATLNDGLSFTGDDETVKVDRKLGQTLNVKGGADKNRLTENNIGVVAEPTTGALNVKLAKDVNLGGDGSLQVADVIINQSGINAGNKQIKNVAPGVDGTDAVNVNQLNAVGNKVNKLDKRIRGIGASSAAAASLPQVYIPGKSMVAAAAGGYAGASAVSVGYSRASDNGKLILKLQGTANSQGHLSGGVGVGYQW
ncbi:MAG: YadA-like family protein, partial [Pasteurellaceae bacterium]|nr:YadA-like family protein [Pasteurellaceae bacterium]